MNAYTPRLERIADLRRRIHRVVDYIDENLDADLSLEHLAEIACISPFHFHRLYTRLVGASPADTVRRLRLLRAMNAILTSGRKVAQAANAAGYGSSQAFARAFRREFGCSARQMRAKPPALPDSSVMEFAIVERAASEMNALMHSDIRIKADVLSVDAQTYGRVLGRGSQHSLTIYFDDLLTPYDQRVRCGVCFEGDPDSIPEDVDVQRLQIAGGVYARIEKRGRLLDFAPQWRELLSQTLPRSGWVQRAGPILRQHVSDRATTPPSQRLCYLYLPVEPLITTKAEPSPF